MEKISLYSETFGKRVTRWYKISTIDNVLNNSDNNNLFNNVVEYLLNMSGYNKFNDEFITYIIK